MRIGAGVDAPAPSDHWVLCDIRVRREAIEVEGNILRESGDAGPCDRDLVEQSDVAEGVVVDALYRQSGKWAKAGFPTDESEALINQLQFETDIDQRAALANQIVQMSIDDNAFGYVGLFNKVSVARPGVTGFSEDNPFDFYGLTPDTDIA